jgi:hypothetical protein
MALQAPQCLGECLHSAPAPLDRCSCAETALFRQIALACSMRLHPPGAPSLRQQPVGAASLTPVLCGRPLRRLRRELAEASGAKEALARRLEEVEKSVETRVAVHKSDAARQRDMLARQAQLAESHKQARAEAYNPNSPRPGNRQGGLPESAGLFTEHA